MPRPDPRDAPMSAQADESAVVDAWQGARIGHRARLDALAEQRRSFVEIDLGEPRVPRVVSATLMASLFVTLVEFQRYGTHPTALDLDHAGGSSVVALARGDWSSVVLANLLHGGIEHIALNAFTIYLVGRWLEHVIGRWALLAVVTVGMLGTTIGALIAAPLTVSIGASGIAFALFGCGLVVDPRAKTGLGAIVRPLLILNVISTFVVPGISIGGHLGGLVAGLLVGLVVWHRSIDLELPSIGRVRRARAAGIAVVASALLVWTLVWHSVAPSSARSVGQRVATQLVDARGGASTG